jgi:hypothetical protein
LFVHATFLSYPLRQALPKRQRNSANGIFNGFSLEMTFEA